MILIETGVALGLIKMERKGGKIWIKDKFKT